MRYRLLASYQGARYEAGIGPGESGVVLFAACPPPEDLHFELGHRALAQDGTPRRGPVAVRVAAGRAVPRRALRDPGRPDRAGAHRLPRARRAEGRATRLLGGRPRGIRADRAPAGGHRDCRAAAADRRARRRRRQPPRPAGERIGCGYRNRAGDVEPVSAGRSGGRPRSRSGGRQAGPAGRVPWVLRDLRVGRARVQFQPVGVRQPDPERAPPWPASAGSRPWLPGGRPGPRGRGLGSAVRRPAVSGRVVRRAADGWGAVG